jgi:hypothetical protein
MAKKIVKLEQADGAVAEAPVCTFDSEAHPWFEDWIKAAGPSPFHVGRFIVTPEEPANQRSQKPRSRKPASSS